MSADEASVRAALVAEEAALRAELDLLTAVVRDPAATIGFGKRVGEGTTEAIGRIERVGQAEALDAKLRDVHRALEKLADGSYGICDACGRPIGAERLAARPSSTRCIGCSSRIA